MPKYGSTYGSVVYCTVVPPVMTGMLRQSSSHPTLSRWLPDVVLHDELSVELTVNGLVPCALDEVVWCVVEHHTIVQLSVIQLSCTAFTRWRCCKIRAIKPADLS